MSTTAANVRVAVTGAVYNAPLATPLPSTAIVALNAAFLAREIGYLTEDGITQAINEDSSDIKAWQNADIVRKIRTSQDLTYAFAMLETSPLTLETYYGNYTAATADSGVAQITGAALGHKAWVLHVIDGLARIRLVVPDGEITERGETVMVNGEALSYPITITAYPDASGVKAYVYLDTDVTVSA